VSISEISKVADYAALRSGSRGAEVHAFLDASLSQMLVELTEWIQIRSVAGPPDAGMHLEASASWLAQKFRDIGFPIVEVLPTGPSFAVYAEWCPDPNAPTYLVYSHHDVRAARETSWNVTDAFTPIMRGHRLFGRGSSDAKGQVMAHLWGLKAHLGATGKSEPDVNLKFLIEGEEELGSPHLADLLAQNTDRFAADVVIFSDTLQWSAEHPALCTSIRGMISHPRHDQCSSRDPRSGTRHTQRSSFGACSKPDHRALHAGGRPARRARTGRASRIL
jgi:acetylornithine deacetylase/succinyl-diaminopimelate desuccinylase-like protein